MTARRVIRWASTASLALGLLLLADVAMTMLWQEPVTAAIGWHARQNINHSHEKLTPLTPRERVTVRHIRYDTGEDLLPGQSPSLAASHERRHRRHSHPEASRSLPRDPGD